MTTTTGAVTVCADGEVNFYTLGDERRWLARVQFNGELRTPEQEQMAEAFARTLPVPEIGDGRVLTTLDTVARGCALWADACVGKAADDWGRSCNEDFDTARAAIVELIAADRELDAAADELADAKRAKGNWRVNPLGHNHPAVLRMRAAKARRTAALTAFGETA